MAEYIFLDNVVLQNPLQKEIKESFAEFLKLDVNDHNTDYKVVEVF